MKACSLKRRPQHQGKKGFEVAMYIHDHAIRGRGKSHNWKMPAFYIIRTRCCLPSHNLPHVKPKRCKVLTLTQGLVLADQPAAKAIILSHLGEAYGKDNLRALVEQSCYVGSGGVVESAAVKRRTPVRRPPCQAHEAEVRLQEGGSVSQRVPDVAETRPIGTHCATGARDNGIVGATADGD